MGCYDTITFKKSKHYRLPRPRHALAKGINFYDLSYQTKDLGEGMSTYEVREDGYIYEYTPIQKWVKDSNAKELSDRMGRMEIVEEKWKIRKNITAYIKTYESIRNDDLENDYWIEYQIHIKKGKVDEVKLISWDVLPNLERKQSIEKHKQQLQEWQHRKNKPWMKYIYLPYANALRITFRAFRRAKAWFPTDYAVQSFLENPAQEIRRWRRIRNVYKSLDSN
jgi:hypothetical protein